MSDSRYIFDYLNDVWELLSEEDQLIFAETWKAYEQSYGYVWMQQFESDLANTIQNLPLYNVQRWLQHVFDGSTQALRAATYRAIQDVSSPVDVSSRFLLRIALDGAAPVEIDVRGSNPLKTTGAEIVAKINSALGQSVAALVLQGQLIQFTSKTKGPTSSFEFLPASDSSRDASAIVIGIDPSLLPQKFPKFAYEYQLADKLIVGIPFLQDKVHDELVTSLLTEGVDYAIEFGSGIISFASTPAAKMWAKDTLVNYETPYNNFGYLVDLYDANTPSYLKSVKGLWYAFWTGPRPENIRRSLYLLFGLPTASKSGTVENVTPTAIKLRYKDGTFEVFQIPVDLISIVAIGEEVTQFQPLVDGIAVYDKVNYPGFLEKEVGRSGVIPFLTQNASRGTDPSTDESKGLKLLEENTYLPQINVNAFISQGINIGNIKTFLRNIQPRSRSYLFQVLVGSFRDPVLLQDEGLTGFVTDKYPNGRPALGLNIRFDATPNVDWNNNTMGNQDTWDEAENNDYTGLILDDEVLNFGESVGVEVYEAAVLIDSFTVEG